MKPLSHVLRPNTIKLIEQGQSNQWSLLRFNPIDPHSNMCIGDWIRKNYLFVYFITNMQRFYPIFWIQYQKNLSIFLIISNLDQKFMFYKIWHTQEGHLCLLSPSLNAKPLEEEIMGTKIMTSQFLKSIWSVSYKPFDVDNFSIQWSGR